MHCFVTTHKGCTGAEEAKWKDSGTVWGVWCFTNPTSLCSSFSPSRVSCGTTLLPLQQVKISHEAEQEQLLSPRSLWHHLRPDSVPAPKPGWSMADLCSLAGRAGSTEVSPSRSLDNNLCHTVPLAHTAVPTIPFLSEYFRSNLQPPREWKQNFKIPKVLLK